MLAEVGELGGDPKGALPVLAGGGVFEALKLGLHSMVPFSNAYQRRRQANLIPAAVNTPSLKILPEKYAAPVLLKAHRIFRDPPMFIPRAPRFGPSAGSRQPFAVAGASRGL
ncbi:hypothetical protein JCM16408A_26760 [Methylobacterium phyllosphaerae]